jgi:D-ribose pyranose/furanose isomerase RbsD
MQSGSGILLMVCSHTATHGSDQDIAMIDCWVHCPSGKVKMSIRFLAGMQSGSGILLMVCSHTATHGSDKDIAVIYCWVHCPSGKGKMTISFFAGMPSASDIRLLVCNHMAGITDLQTLEWLLRLPKIPRQEVLSWLIDGLIDWLMGFGWLAIGWLVKWVIDWCPLDIIQILLQNGVIMIRTSALLEQKGLAAPHSIQPLKWRTLHDNQDQRELMVAALTAKCITYACSC